MVSISRDEHIPLQYSEKIHFSKVDGDMTAFCLERTHREGFLKRPLSSLKNLIVFVRTGCGDTWQSNKRRIKLRKKKKIIEVSVRPKRDKEITQESRAV